ncbi:MAG: ArnT family glycosyltransferase [Bacteroidia bacterium]
MSKKTNVTLFVLALFLLTYTALRAVLLSFTWDEAYSFLEFVRNGVIIPEKFEQMSANNHLLNTALDVLLFKCFGNSEIVLRIPALIAHLLFLYFTYRLVRNFSPPLLAIASFVILNFNPYLLDFFSLSRGYALSIALMTGSVFFLDQYIHSKEEKHVKWIILFSALATLANFVLLNFMVVMLGLTLLLLMRGKNTREFIRAAAVPFAIAAISLCFLVPVILKLKEAGALFYGGKTGFWTDTFSTITDRYFYELGYNYWIQRLAKGFVILIVSVAGIASVRMIIRRTEKPNDLFLISLFCLLFFSALSTIIQHYLFGTLYLQDRTALYLVILFCLLLIFFADRVSSGKKIVLFLYCAFGGFSIFHFAHAANLHYVLEWKWDADIREMITDLEKIKSIPPGKQNISIGIPLEMDQGINYYKAKDHLDWLNPVERSDLRDRRYNYLFFGPEEERSLNKDSMVILKRYPGTNNVLARPKFPLVPNGENQYAHSEKFNPFIFDENVEYGPAITYGVNDSITPDKNAELIYCVSGASKQPDKDVFIVVSIENAEGPYLWKRASLKDVIKAEGDWTGSFSVLVPREATRGDVVKAYIWNPNKQHLQLRMHSLSWLTDK